MQTREQPQQNPRNKNEYWCSCPNHKSYIHESNFYRNAKNKFGIDTACKSSRKKYAKNYLKEKGNRTEKRIKDEVLDRSKWPNFKKYLMENPGYCQSLLDCPFDEKIAKKLFNGIFD